MTPQAPPEPPKCCCFNIKTATVALGIFHMVSPGRGQGQGDRKPEVEPLQELLLWFTGFPDPGMFSVPKRKTQ